MHLKPNSFVHGHRVQFAVDRTLELFVRDAVAQDSSDKQQLQPMIRTVKQQGPQNPGELLTESGYCSNESFRYFSHTKIDG
jgi:hypothetical protein